MKKYLSLAAMGAALLAAGLAFGQTPSGAVTAPGKAPKYVLMATIKGAEANREFQNNVHLLQMQRQTLIELNNTLDKEKDAQKKKDLKAQIDTLTAKIVENNNVMVKSYGFSLLRNYTLEVETANIYMEVSDEEAAKIEQTQKDQAKKK